jgi:methylated-DNA-[protein]-cysteine S-methyltransferase
MPKSSEERRNALETPAATKVMDSPIGPLLIGATARGLRRLDFGAKEPVAAGRSGAVAAVLGEAERQLREYFGGGRRTFDIPLDIEGSEFQMRVWAEIAAIPYGATLTYGELAAAAGRPSAARAAGAACGANPVAIVIPCHRVVAGNRALHGFGGGLDTKAWLLRHEGHAVDGLRLRPAAGARQPAIAVVGS